MQLKAKIGFSWAHRGCDVEQYEKGQLIETEDEDLIRVATEEGWATKVKSSKSLQEESVAAPVPQAPQVPESTEETAADAVQPDTPQE